MSARKDGLDRVISQIHRKEASVGHLTKEKNTPQRWQAHHCIGGYVPGESTWSQNHDSAASMFPLVPGWEEVYQDLSTYCQTEHNMPSAKVDVIKSSSCIVPGDELNTPEIRVQEFNYPAHGNVSREDTSPVSLFDGGIWNPPVDITQITLNEKGGEGVTPNKFIEPSESHRKCIQTSNEIVSDQNQSEVNEIWISSPDHEEVVSSSDENTTIVDEQVHHNIDLNMLSQDNIIEISFVDEQNQTTMTETTVNEDVVVETNMEASLRYLESLLMKTENELSSENNIANNIKLEADTYMDIDPELICELPAVEETDEQIINSTSETIPAAQCVEKPLRDRSELSLNLAEVLATTDDLISTPIILDALLDEEVPSFQKLMNFVQGGQELKTEAVPSTTTVDFSAVSSTPSINPQHNNSTTESELSGTTDGISFSAGVVKPLIIKISSSGQPMVSQKQESKPEVGRVRYGRKKIVINKTNKKISQQEIETGSILKANIANKQHTSKRKISAKDVSTPKPRGRPAREPIPSTSREDTVRPKRQRKVTESSDYDYDDISSPPSSKRSRLSSVESESDRYRELRDRNNEASRKSRFNRKLKEQEMKELADTLERENQSLRIKADEMGKLVKKLRQSLLEAVTKSKKKDE